MLIPIFLINHSASYIKTRNSKIIFWQLPSIDELFPKNNQRISNFIPVTFMIHSKYRKYHLEERTPSKKPKLKLNKNCAKKVYPFWHILILYFPLNYKTNFLIIITPLAIVINTTNPNVKYNLICPVLIDNITGASSISSSPAFLLSGVESISGTPYSL